LGLILCADKDEEHVELLLQPAQVQLHPKQ
jgi:hypothetical protein